MKNKKFKDMWDKMQCEGYFRNHPDYADWHGDHQDAIAFIADEINLNVCPDSLFEHIDFSKDDLIINDEINPDIEKAIKKNEYYWLPKMFALPQNGTVLDLGCGYGRSIEWLHKIYNQAIGIDISDYVIDIANQRFQSIGNAVFYSCDGLSFPSQIEERSIDLIYCFTVFQHIPREFTLNYLKESSRVVKPNGKIIFNLLSGMNEDVNDGVIGAEWVIGYNRDQTVELVQQAGLQVNRIVTWRAKNSDVRWLWVEASLR